MSQEWPAVCGCGATYDPEAWIALPLCGIQDDGEGGFLELRNCKCRSTIAVDASFSLETLGGHRHVVHAVPGEHTALVAAGCPGCGATPFKARGEGRSIHSRDTYVADARAACCDKVVGKLFAKVDTIFGLEEDEAMLVYGRARVYGGSPR